MPSGATASISERPTGDANAPEGLVAKPYYTRGGITIYHADCRDILPAIDPETVELVLTDPPYGIKYDPGDASRGGAHGGAGRKKFHVAGSNFPKVFGDGKPFDPTHLLRFKWLVLFGGNHYANKLPPSSSWLVWDKVAGMRVRREIGFSNQSDVELIWTNLGGSARLIPYRWSGMMKDGERREHRQHPTQKPVDLLAAILSLWTPIGSLVLDPYMGSGSTLVAAARLKRRAIGIEIMENYCDIAAKRLVKEFGA